MSIPQHVAIIMDGNRRWARSKGLPVVLGHRKVAEEKIEELIEHAGKLGIKYITFWAFSTENWNRPADEVDSYMQIFRWAFANKAKKLADKGARLRIIGDMSKFDPDIQDSMQYWLEKTKDNNKITVIFALNYGGRNEIIRAIKKSNGSAQELTEENFGEYLDTIGMPDPDLIIRTGGEQRLSGFMLWQCQYSEFYFPETLMPDFDTKEFDKALDEYSRRQRRMGK